MTAKKRCTECHREIDFSEWGYLEQGYIYKAYDLNNQIVYFCKWSCLQEFRAKGLELIKRDYWDKCTRALDNDENTVSQCVVKAPRSKRQK